VHHHNPGVRLRDIAARTGITERTAYSIVTDRTKPGYVAKDQAGRCNRYQIQAHLPLPEPAGPSATHAAAIGRSLASNHMSPGCLACCIARVHAANAVPNRHSICTIWPTASPRAARPAASPLG
jgi:hypothetical protein